MAPRTDDADELLDLSVQRADALGALRSGPLRRAEIESTLGVSRTTAHRIARSLADHGLAERTPEGYRLTPLGTFAADEIAGVRSTFEAAFHLRPFLRDVRGLPFELDVSLFDDANVAETGPGDPYGPVSRFMELLQGSDSLRGFDTTSVAPVYVDEIRREIMGGMDVSVVYLPPVVEQIADSYPEELADATASGHLELYTHESLPFGLALFDDRLGLGAYDDETGMLTVFVDTDHPDAIEWGERLYELYREEARPFEPPTRTTE